MRIIAISTRMVAQSSDGPCPVSFDHGSPLELEAELGEKRDSGIKGFHHDADVVHPLKRHAAHSSLLKKKKKTEFPRGRALKIDGVSPPVTLPLIDHLALRVRDVRRSRTFYERALEPFGVKVVESSQGPGFAIEGGGDFWIGEGEPPAAPVHVAFAAADRATVDKFHRAAVEAGGRDNGAPGLRPHYHAGYYAAFVIDPDGNNVEAVFHGDRQLPAT